MKRLSGKFRLNVLNNEFIRGYLKKLLNGGEIMNVGDDVNSFLMI